MLLNQSFPFPAHTNTPIPYGSEPHESQKKTNRAVKRARVKKECSRNLRPEVITVSDKMTNRPDA
jgi:hypothetical protein